MPRMSYPYRLRPPTRHQADQRADEGLRALILFGEAHLRQRFDRKHADLSLLEMDASNSSHSSNCAVQILPERFGIWERLTSQQCFDFVGDVFQLRSNFGSGEAACHLNRADARDLQH